MDTNLRIIELVERRPKLYARCNDFPGRANQWKEIAEILKTDVPLVKSRWHLLRAKYMEQYSSVLKGNRTTFKYLSEMSFLANHINLNAFEMYSKENDQYRTEPEFNITKEDLENASDDDSTSEFIELELDDESHRELAQIPFSGTEEVGQNEYVEPIYIDDVSDGSQPPQEEVQISPNNKQKQQQVDIFIEVPASDPEPKDDKSSIVKKDTNNRNNATDETEKNDHDKDEHHCKTETIPAPTKSEEKPPLLSEEKPITSASSENFRCEDTIFGELVTATLRQMQTDKKKAVKREIMNLLFT